MFVDGYVVNDEGYVVSDEATKARYAKDKGAFIKFHEVDDITIYIERAALQRSPETSAVVRDDLKEGCH